MDLVALTEYLVKSIVVDEEAVSVKEFDSDIKVPVAGRGTNTVRKEYVMPYTFNLHEGENTIRLHMAGGYRSTFYNFTFRPC